MQKIATELPDVWELRPQVWRDPRGWFVETYHEQKFAALGITGTFVQDNHSLTLEKDTLRGLHYQLNKPQAKICRVVQGEVLDIAVDIRRGSPTFGRWAKVVLSSEQMNMVYVPAGFAHGFLVLAEPAQFLYKCSDFYDKNDEYGVRWNDPAIGFDWKVASPKLSGKDAEFLPLSAIDPSKLPVFRG